VLKASRVGHFHENINKKTSINSVFFLLIMDINLSLIN
jgi:hypothetical protein